MLQAESVRAGKQGTEEGVEEGTGSQEERDVERQGDGKCKSAMKKRIKMPKFDAEEGKKQMTTTFLISNSETDDFNINIQDTKGRLEHNKLRTMKSFSPTK